MTTRNILVSILAILVLGNIALTCYVVSDNCLRHLPYFPANEKDLVTIRSFQTPEGTERKVSLIEPAAEALRDLLLAAKADGVLLDPVSGFRSVERQRYLFMSHLARQDLKDAIKVVAPPGFSEHHTGLAVDFSFNTGQRTVISQKFMTTEGYRWLKQNADRFGFKLSFPKKNESPVMFEPWHWRFVGTRKAEMQFNQTSFQRLMTGLRLFIAGKYMCNIYR